MKQKRLIFILLVTMCMFLVTACASEITENDERQKVNIACMKGPTAIGMINLLDKSDNGNTRNEYNHTIVGTADEITGSLINGNLDIAAVPCNLACVLNNKTNGEIVTVAVNTLGVLYIVENGDNIHSISDLKGKTIYSTGQGTTPEYTLRYLLEKAGINPDEGVNIEYKSEATEVVASIVQNPEAVAMLPQPYVMVAMSKSENLRIAIDVTKEWENITDGDTVVTGVIVSRKEFIEKNREAFEQFLVEYEASTIEANSNIEGTADLLEKYDVFKADIALKAIPYCNVTYMDNEEMQRAVIPYLKVLYDENPASVGGKIPEKGLFYIENEE